MPSHLTRQVFRRIISNEPIIYRGCLRRQNYSSPASSQNGRRVHIARSSAFPLLRRYQQRRTLFGLGGMFRQKAPRDAKEANYDPGIEKMMEYAKMERLRARLPPVEDVAHALRLFGISRRKRTKFEKSIEDTQAQLVLQSLRYCLKAQKDEPNEETHAAAQFSVQQSDLVNLANALRCKEPRQLSQAHLDLAKVLYDELCTPRAPSRVATVGLYTYVTSLTWSGRSQVARSLLLNSQSEVNAGTSELTAQRTEGDDVSKVGEADGISTEDALLVQILTVSKYCRLG